MIDRISAGSVNSMMETIRAYQNKASNGVEQLNIKPPLTQDIQAPKTELPNFTDSVKNLLSKVNEVQVQFDARSLSTWRRHSFDRCGLGYAEILPGL